MSRVGVDAEVPALVQGFRLPRPLGFGRCMAPVMFRADFEDGAWAPGRVMPYGAIPLDPAAKVLHYAQVIFEGLKAYHVENPGPAIFRPGMNARRLNASARRMMMPEVPEELFVAAVSSLTACCASLIPRDSGQSLYLRPFMFGTEPALGLGPSNAYAFMVIASPSEAFAPGPLRIRVEREGSRAAPGGTGGVKVSGNYGASLSATAAAAAQGFQQPLWLDAATHRHIEELSVMNFFAVIDGVLHTPALTGSILPGVTRASVIDLARAGGTEVREAQMAVDDLLDLIRSGRCTEAFACGTAVVISPISAIGDKDGQVYELNIPPDSLAGRLRKELLDIQEGRAPDRFGWMHAVPGTNS